MGRARKESHEQEKLGGSRKVDNREEAWSSYPDLERRDQAMGEVMTTEQHDLTPEEKIQALLTLVNELRDTVHEMGDTIDESIDILTRLPDSPAVSPVPPTAPEISKEWLDELIEELMKCQHDVADSTLLKYRLLLQHFRNAILSAPPVAPTPEDWKCHACFTTNAVCAAVIDTTDEGPCCDLCDHQPASPAPSVGELE